MAGFTIDHTNKKVVKNKKELPFEEELQIAKLSNEGYSVEVKEKSPKQKKQQRKMKSDADDFKAKKPNLEASLTDDEKAFYDVLGNNPQKQKSYLSMVEAKHALAEEADKEKLEKAYQDAYQKHQEAMNAYKADKENNKKPQGSILQNALKAAGYDQMKKAE